jgi:hypothetical protein
MSTSRGLSVRRKVGDRRTRARFDIVGDLWGTVEAAVQLPIANIGRGGALIQSGVQLPPESIHRLRIKGDDREEDLSVAVRVRHVATQVSNAGELSYLIGVEFVSAAPELLERVDRWVAAAQPEAAGA